MLSDVAAAESRSEKMRVKGRGAGSPHLNLELATSLVYRFALRMESTSSPSGSQQTETDTPSTLLSLPTEVLSRVVALCALQDAAYRERLLAAKHKELEISQLLKGVGMSLQSLSLVNKQLHALCCAQLFKVSSENDVDGHSTSRGG